MTNTEQRDKRFDTLDENKTAEISSINNAYDSAIESADKLYEDQINAVKSSEAMQKQLQNASNAQLLSTIESQKKDAQDSYIREQSGAYADYQKQSARHGVSAERIAAEGMVGSGFSESSRVSMYNTYQNRVATARAAYTQAVQNYNDSIKEAKLQNSSALAEIAQRSLKEQLSLMLEGFKYKSGLENERVDSILKVSDKYYTREEDLLDRIENEKKRENEQRRYEQEREDEQQADKDGTYQSNYSYILNAVMSGEYTSREAEAVANALGITPEDKMSIMNVAAVYGTVHKNDGAEEAAKDETELKRQQVSDFKSLLSDVKKGKYSLSEAMVIAEKLGLPSELVECIEAAFALDE